MEKKFENSKIDIEYSREINPEEIKNYISFENIIENQLKSVCKIKKNNGYTGTGFLCKIPDQNSADSLPVLITSYHVLSNSDIIEGNEIKLIFNNEEIPKSLIIDKERKIYTNNDKYNITIIEIKQKDNLNDNHFLNIEYAFLSW